MRDKSQRTAAQKVGAEVRALVPVAVLELDLASVVRLMVEVQQVSIAALAVQREDGLL